MREAPSGAIKRQPKLLVLLMLGTLLVWGPGQGAAGTDPISDFALQPIPEGVIIRFPQPMAIDSLTISATHAGIWGTGRLARVAVARTRRGSTLAALQPGESTLTFPITDPTTPTIEIVALLTSPSEAPSGGYLRLEGTTASRRHLEIELKNLAGATLDWQARHGCFCCHRLLPMAMSLDQARAKGLALPEPVLASLAQHLIAWQKPDGSFSFSEAPEYGVVTPTLCGAAAMAWMRQLSPALEPPLLRAVTFLVSWQQPDGSVVPDFTFPPLMVGRPFAAWLFGQSLGQVKGLLQERGFSPNPRFTWAWQRVRAWLQNGGSPSPEKLVFSWLSDPEALSGSPEKEGEARAAVASFQAQLSPERDPELFILSEVLQRRLGAPPRPPAPASPARTGTVRKAAWVLLAGILQEP